jgi:hypothetical protein
VVEWSAFVLRVRGTPNSYNLLPTSGAPEQDHVIRTAVVQPAAVMQQVQAGIKYQCLTAWNYVVLKRKHSNMVSPITHSFHTVHMIQRHWTKYSFRSLDFSPAANLTQYKSPTVLICSPVSRPTFLGNIKADRTVPDVTWQCAYHLEIRERGGVAPRVSVLGTRGRYVATGHLHAWKIPPFKSKQQGSWEAESSLS